MRNSLPSPVAVLRDRSNVTVARVTLGLTAYLDDPMRWAREGAAAALRMFLAMAPRARLAWFTTSAMSGREPLSPHALERIQEALPLPWGRGVPRHAFELRLADATDTAGFGFAYREIDPARGGRSWLQITLPDDHPSDDLAQYTIELAQTLPLHAAIAGHLGVWHAGYVDAGFAALRTWCRRYLGLDLQHPDATSLGLGDALPGSGWLTLLGPALASRADLTTPWKEEVAVLRLRHATLVRAGAAPTLGDANTLTFPRAYAEVAHRLAGLLAPAPPEFPSWDADAGETSAWRRRFIEPEGWR